MSQFEYNPHCDCGGCRVGGSGSHVNPTGSGHTTALRSSSSGLLPSRPNGGDSGTSQASDPPQGESPCQRHNEAPPCISCRIERDPEFAEE